MRATDLLPGRFREIGVDGIPGLTGRKDFTLRSIYC
jgi:hypothetical protein